MAQEITTSLSLSVNKASIMSSAVARAVTGLLFNMNGNAYVQGDLSVAISATVIPLGGVTAPHWAFFVNKDTTNFVKLRNGAGGADFGRLYPGEPAVIPLDNACVPYAIADTAPCIIEYLIFQY